MSAKICIVTTGQPATNPRVVKEADALEEAGYQVTVVYCDGWAAWASAFDKEILKNRKWRHRSVVWSKTNRWIYYKSRLRHSLSRLLFALGFDHFLESALFRTYPELFKSAGSVRADLYIAHYPPALSVACRIAKRHHAKVAFDAEDFHTQESEPCLRFLDRRIPDAVGFVESACLPLCSYITASSEPIATAYASKYHISPPTVVLNTFNKPPTRQSAPDSKQSAELSLYWFSQTIGPNRGLEQVIDAVSASRRPISLHLQGSIRAEYRELLRRKWRDGDIPGDRLVFLEPAHPDKLLEAASKFDVGLALEEKRPLNHDLCASNKLFTYLLAGLSIIATRTQGQLSILRAIGAAGWSFESGDTRALTDRLTQLTENREMLLTSKRESAFHGNNTYAWNSEKLKLVAAASKALGS